MSYWAKGINRLPAAPTPSSDLRPLFAAVLACRWQLARTSLPLLQLGISSLAVQTTCSNVSVHDSSDA